MGKTSIANRKKAPVATPAAVPAATTATATALKRGEFPESTFSIKARTFSKKGNYSKNKKNILQGIQHGCVRCMSEHAYGVLYDGATNMAEKEHCHNNKHLHLALPLFLELFIRGHLFFDDILDHDRIYAEHERCHDEEDYSRFGDRNPAMPLCRYWKKFSLKTKNDDDDWENRTQVKQDCKAVKKERSNNCAVCKKEDDPETVTLMKCDGCHVYFYCSRTCQKKMWGKGQHAGVCRQLRILQKYHKPFAKKIWEDIAVRGIAPQDIPELQELRQRLGLSRPLADYQDLLDEAKAGRLDSAKLILPRKDGTVQIGSFPGPI